MGNICPICSAGPSVLVPLFALESSIGRAVADCTVARSTQKWRHFWPVSSYLKERREKCVKASGGGRREEEDRGEDASNSPKRTKFNFIHSRGACEPAPVRSRPCSLAAH